MKANNFIYPNEQTAMDWLPVQVYPASRPLLVRDRNKSYTLQIAFHIASGRKIYLPKYRTIPYLVDNSIFYRADGNSSAN